MKTPAPDITDIPLVKVVLELVTDDNLQLSSVYEYNAMSRYDLLSKKTPSSFDAVSTWASDYCELIGRGIHVYKNGKIRYCQAPIIFLEKSKVIAFNHLALHLPPSFDRVILVVREVDIDVFKLPTSPDEEFVLDHKRATSRAQLVDLNGHISVRCEDLLTKYQLNVFVLQGINS